MLNPRTPLAPEITRDQLLATIESNWTGKVALTLVIIDEAGDVYHHYHTQFDRGAIVGTWPDHETIQSVAQGAVDFTNLGICVTGFEYLGSAGISPDRHYYQGEPALVIVVKLTSFTGTMRLDKVSRIGGRISKCWAEAQAMWDVLEPMAVELGIRCHVSKK